MNRNQFLAWPAYAVAFTLVLVPAFDASMSLASFNPSSEQWRFGALGMLSNAFMIPAVGLLVAFVTATTLGHRRFLRVLGGACAALAVLTFIGLGLFALDAVQTRLNVQPQIRLSFVVASFTAAGKMILAIITLSGFGYAGLKTKLSGANATVTRGRSRQPLPPVQTSIVIS